MSQSDSSECTRSVYSDESVVRGRMRNEEEERQSAAFSDSC